MAPWTEVAKFVSIDRMMKLLYAVKHVVFTLPGSLQTARRLSCLDRCLCACACYRHTQVSTGSMAERLTTTGSSGQAPGALPTAGRCCVQGYQQDVFRVKHAVYTCCVAISGRSGVGATFAGAQKVGRP
jgi:hypothetical protein